MVNCSKKPPSNDRTPNRGRVVPGSGEVSVNVIAPPLFLSLEFLLGMILSDPEINVVIASGSSFLGTKIDSHDYIKYLVQSYGACALGLT